jgi:hypothetical protein
MNEQGFVGVFSLWIGLLIVSIGLAIFAVVRWHRANANARLFEVRSFFIAHTAALMAFQNNFSQEALAFEFEGGQVALERLHFKPDKEVTIRCAVSIGKYQRKSDVEWVKLGESWKAVSWREQ